MRTDMTGRAEGASPAARHHDLDALRAAAMLLGVVLHSLLLLLPLPSEEWPVQDAWVAGTPTASNLYLHPFLLIHGMRMPVFFVISGFFTAMLWQRRGLRAMVEHRLKRIGLPLALAAATIVPATALAFAVADPVHFDGPGWLGWPLAWLDRLFHVWFLWHLLLLVGLFAVLAQAGVSFVSPAWAVLTPLVSFLGMALMDDRIVGPDPADHVLADPVVLGFYAAFFLFGAFFHQRGVAIRRWWAFAILPAVVLAYPLSALVLIDETVQPQSAEWAMAAFHQTVYAWLMCFGLLGLFRAVASRERRWVRYMSDASYWLYLAHMPLVVVAQWLLVDAPISPHLKFATVLFVGVALPLAVYQTCVRYTWLGTMLNGPRRRPATPRSPPSGAGSVAGVGTME